MKKVEVTLFANTDFFYVSSFIFKKNHILTEKDNPSEKTVLVKEELDGIDRLRGFAKTSAHQWGMWES